LWFRERYELFLYRIPNCAQQACFNRLPSDPDRTDQSISIRATVTDENQTIDSK
jgi:hypothetical protein